MNYDLIVTKKVRNEGIGIAINDRLERAGSGELKDFNVNSDVKKIYTVYTDRVI